jgi:hypothetical protein
MIQNSINYCLKNLEYIVYLFNLNLKNLNLILILILINSTTTCQRGQLDLIIDF